MPRAIEPIPRSAARTLLLRGLGLLDNPDRTSGQDAALGLIERVGFVQLDSINIVERAHHHILWARMHSYRPQMLDALQRSGRVFEHWTHDASVIPSPWFPHWRHRFGRVARGAWLRQRMGRGHREVRDRVIGRIRDEGPLRDFEHAGRKGGPWWDWKPAKAALEYWWRTGHLAIRHRERFEKVYDLTERVLPGVHAMPPPHPDEHADWACGMAMERLGIASPRELAAFWALVPQIKAAAWCERKVESGELKPVRIQGQKPARLRFAPVDWRQRVKEANDAPSPIRLLSPFDPLIRDRDRCQRLFGFDYRFEAFVPEAKRKHGYYVLPILRGDRLIGRIDPKLDREAGVLSVRRVWWEPGVRPTRARIAELEAALNRYAGFLGATQITVTDWGR